jgi:hypothetical protein
MATDLKAESVWQTPGPPIADTNCETTRYLCAAAYTDGKFRETVLAQDRESVRSRPLEIGVDVDLVLDHCLKARRLKFNRDLLLCGVTVLLLPTLFVVSPTGNLAVLFCWLAGAIIVAVEAFRVDRIRRHELSKSEFLGGNAETMLSEEGNVIVYSGFSPFVGAGFDAGGWSFAVDLERGKQGVAAHEPRPFTLAELYDHVGQVFDLLQIPNLRLSRKLFISGRCVRGTPILPDPHRRPVESLPVEMIANYAENSSKDPALFVRRKRRVGR